MDTLVELLGRFHPMLVHLPIGILLLAIVFVILSEKEIVEISRGAIQITLALGSLFALVSCGTGYLLSRNDDYDAEAVSLHQWMAVFLTLVSFAAWYLHHEYWLRDRVMYLVSFVIFFSLTATGHLGASLTHGSAYLVEPFAQSDKKFDASVVRSDSRFYADVIQPILQNRCVSCHGVTRQKGKLRMDTKEEILKGGESGKILVAGSAGDSELWNRLMLPLTDDDHMPPKEKGQLSEEEKTLLKLWIESGADFEKRIGEVLTAEQLAVIAIGRGVEEGSDVPDKDVPVPNADAIRVLLSEGVSVTPVSSESNFLSVNFVSVPKEASRILPILNELEEHVVWLKLSGCKLHADDFKTIVKLSNLTRLSLEDTSITDLDVEQLAKLESIIYLNMKGTNVSASAVEKLAALPALRELYLFETKVAPGDRARLKVLFENTKLDFGDYQVPTLETDTTVLNAPKN